MTYSFEGTTFAVGSHDKSIYIYDVLQHYSLRGKLQHGHSSYVVHMDFGCMLHDGEHMDEHAQIEPNERSIKAEDLYLQSSCGNLELKFWNIGSMREEKVASKVKDVQWATWTNSLGFPVQGCLSDGSKGLINR